MEYITTSSNISSNISSNAAFNRPVDLDAIRKKKGGASFISVPESKREIYLDYLPPLNARPEIIAPIRQPSHTLRLITKAPPPESFSWNNVADVASRGFNLVSGPPSGPPSAKSGQPSAKSGQPSAKSGQPSAVLVGAVTIKNGVINGLFNIVPPKPNPNSDRKTNSKLPSISITAPLNQEMCGGCWAVSSASVLTDRFSIATASVVPLLSYSYLLACSDGTTDMPNQKCGGGFPANAGTFMESNGIASDACRSYGWCNNDSTCNGSSASSGTNIDEGALNNLVPSCKPDTCYTYASDSSNAVSTTPIPKLYKAVPGSTQALITQEAIQADIYTHGPVVCTYTVFIDMATRARPQMLKPGWSNTNNIYVNLGDDNLYDGYSSTKIAGYHAVAVVGWGVEKNPSGLPDDITKALIAAGGLRYWVVRNSWGPNWNGNGFWKCAWTYPDLNINTTVGMDIPLSNIGGGTTFLPLV